MDIDTTIIQRSDIVQVGPYGVWRRRSNGEPLTPETCDSLAVVHDASAQIAARWVYLDLAFLGVEPREDLLDA